MIIHRFLLLLASLVMVLVSVVSAEISTCPDGKGGTRFQDTPCPGEGHYAAPPAAEPLSLALLRTVHPQLLAMFDRWSDAIKVARVTSRLGLAGPIATMQTIRREAKGLTFPGCAGETHRALVAAMTQEIALFVEFMGRRETTYEMERAMRALNPLYTTYADTQNTCFAPVRSIGRDHG